MESKNVFEALNEDTVYSFIFPTSPLNTGELQALCESINKVIGNLTVGFIWHKDEFRVHIPVCKENSELPLHLTSVTCFGDNIEDEWFIVHLLLEISKTFPNLIIQVYDNDGEFLLIEAADYLPSWATPDTTENRVFIFQNSIHLIPATLVNPDTEIMLPDAIQLIADKPEQTSSPQIHQAVLKRIGNYPQDIKDTIHRAVLNLPLDIATLLTLKPSLISPIVNTYCSHDVVDARACKNVKFDETITVQLQFTKCLYAMLKYSKLINTIKNLRINDNDKRNALGFKITCGYEIIMSKLSGDIYSSKEFHKFLKSLTVNGYFKGNLEGSRDYKFLLEQAKEFFLEMECPINTQISNKISQLMQTKEFADMKELMRNKPPGDDLQEDSEDWLNDVNPDQLNDLLNSRYGKQTKLKSDDVINSRTITSQLSNFMKQNSDFEGIETNKLNDNDDNEPITLKPDEFVNSIRKMMDFLSMGKDEDMDSDDDDDDDLEDDSMTEINELDKELREKLNTDEKLGTVKAQTIFQNMMKSMKEEAGSSGPASNILRTIGINKTDVLDSDDDDEPS